MRDSWYLVEENNRFLLLEFLSIIEKILIESQAESRDCLEENIKCRISHNFFSFLAKMKLVHQNFLTQWSFMVSPISEDLNLPIKMINSEMGKDWMEII